MRVVPAVPVASASALVDTARRWSWCTRTMSQRSHDTSPRLAARIAGIGLLAMAILAPFAEMYVRKRLVVAGDAATTAANLAREGLLFRVGILSYIVVIILDIVVAWALHVQLKHVRADLSLVTAWFRLVYSAIFTFAVIRLLDALAPANASQMMASLDGFRTAWTVALAFFGIHLAVLGVLVFVSGYIPKWIGVLVAIAGVGYVTDSVIGILVLGYEARVSLVTFVGEVVLMLWLLLRASKVPEASG